MISLLAVSGANAGSCETNFKSSGVPMLTALSYKSSAVFPALAPKAALANAESALYSQNADNVSVNQGKGVINATQETSGSGREQTWRVVVRKAGKGSKVEVIFAVPQGQVTTDSAARRVICEILKDTAG